MDTNAEYIEFMAKLLKASSDVKEDYKKLSADTQKRIATEVCIFLRAKGMEVTLDTLMDDLSRL